MTTTEAIEHLAARGYNFSAHRIRKFCEKGWIVGAFKPPGGHWDIPADGLDRWIGTFAPIRRRRRCDRP